MLKAPIGDVTDPASPPDENVTRQCLKERGLNAEIAKKGQQQPAPIQAPGNAG